jgi:hypothetical protein
MPYSIVTIDVIIQSVFEFRVLNPQNRLSLILFKIEEKSYANKYLFGGVCKIAA